jgi:hypothetical protein
VQIGGRWCSRGSGRFARTYKTVVRRSVQLASARGAARWRGFTPANEPPPKRKGLSINVNKEKASMITARRSNHCSNHSHSVFAAIALLLGGAVGCGQAPDGSAVADPATGDPTNDPSNGEEFLEAGTFVLRCPKKLTATWAQAAFGTGSDTITGDTLPFPRGPGTPPPTTSPTCALANPGNLKLVRDVRQPSAQIPAACGAKVTISGQGDQLTGVPPFAGWTFKQKALDAVATIQPTNDPAVRNCHLEFRLAPTLVTTKTTLACNAAGETTFTCPNGASPR